MNYVPEESKDEVNESGMIKGVPRYVLDQINSQSVAEKQADYYGPRSAQFASLLLDADETLSQALGNEQKLRDPIGKYKMQMEARMADFKTSNPYTSPIKKQPLPEP